MISLYVRLPKTRKMKPMNWIENDRQTRVSSPIARLTNYRITVNITQTVTVLVASQKALNMHDTCFVSVVPFRLKKRIEKIITIDIIPILKSVNMM